MSSLKHDVDLAIDLAASLLRQAIELQTPHERRQQAELDRMISHAEDKATLIELTDQAFRTHTPARVADQLTHILDVQGVPRFFSPTEQAMLRGFQAFGEYLPGVAVPLVKEKMRRETANVILPAETELLVEHIRNRQRQGVQMNVNLLGEAILGEQEAKRRLQQNIEILRLPEVQCISVKISTLYSQISPIARDYTVQAVADRLESLYRTADRYADPTTGIGKFVYLDMEEYRDLYLTADILREALGRPGLESTRAGIALQAYIPDSFTVMKSLVDWSAQRVQSGGSPLTIRLVKGANMEMERVEASIAGIPQAPYKQKRETDANYKRMLWHLVQAASKQQVRIGLASHNLFDIALGILWAQSHQLGDFLQIEMLEGMANHQRRAIAELKQPMLLYAPACRQDGFLNAIGYLIRRLDENTGPHNFLRHAYRLQPESPEFAHLATDFRRSAEMMDSVSSDPRRDQNRHEPPVQPLVAPHWSEYSNEPDTDWAAPHNFQWADSIIQKWHLQCDASANQVPLKIGQRLMPPNPATRGQTFDPSRPGTLVCTYQCATHEQACQAVTLASQNPDQWQHTTSDHRHQLLRAAAQRLRIMRGDLIGAMIAEAGKTIAEADPEVSEAIDFCEFYPLTYLDLEQFNTISIRPRGVVAVITPWNFPLAIPCGGIAAALAAGNHVILKPASETVMVASLLCQAFWDAGVPESVLQMIPCEDAVAESALVKNPTIDAVILTGGTATAKRMLSVRPGLHLLAETGGKNATIVTAMADRDLAVKHVVHSAFGHSGQKCSATSLLLLENEVFHDPSFRQTLADAVSSLHVGSAWDVHTKMGPLIHPPSGALARGLKTLEDDESWLVMPEHVIGNPNLYRPGIKWNIKPGSFTHLTELFGPVLGVMPFSRLEQAIEIVRSTGYGLTSGLETLDDREMELWKQSVHAGNLYINRPTTGAIVLRQPFGGVGMSAYGPGSKAGGPHYVYPLVHMGNAPSRMTTTVSIDLSSFPNLQRLREHIDSMASEQRIERKLADDLAVAIEGAANSMETEFSKEHDTVRIVGQDNIRRYRPARGITIRIDRQDQLVDALTAICAAVAVGAQFTLSIDPHIDAELISIFESTADVVPGLVHPMEETDEQLAERIRDGDVNRLRLLHRAADTGPHVVACSASFTTIIDEPVLFEASAESLRYLNEQSISYDYHRYGNLGRRSGEPRREVL